jgi:peptidoglycan LD-endopeptidase LytH
MTRVRWIGWGIAALLLLLAAGYASLVRISFGAAPTPVAAPVQVAEAPPAAVPGRLVIPVEGVTAAQLTDTWGQSRGGGTREHHAIDILAPRGTRVLAAAAGTVEKLFESANGGHTLYIRSVDRGTVYYYAHLDRYGVSEGQAVRAGDPIATVGDTGSAAGTPHLHFEIKTMRPGERWWQGTNVNPYPMLAH